MMDQSCSTLYPSADKVDIVEIRDYVQAVRNNAKSLLTLIGKIELDCQISQSTLKYPVLMNLYICQVWHVDCKHEMQCVDLLSVIKEIKKSGKCQCPIKNCKGEFDYYRAKQQLQVSFVHNYVRRSLHDSAREGIFIIKENLEIFVCLPYFGTKNTIYNTYVKHLKHLVNQPIHEKGQFKQLYKATPNEINFYAVCIMGLCKINIPVRHKDCQHTEAYDWISLMNHTATIKKENPTIKQFNCVKTGCKSVFSVGEVELQHDLAIDYDLLPSINQGVPYSFYFRISNQGELKNLATVHSIDAHIDWLRTKDGITNETIQTYQLECYRQADQLIKRSRPKQFEALLLQTLYDEYQVSLLDPITTNIIIVPVRCINCKERKQVADIMTYLFKLQTFKVEQQKLENQNPIAIKQFFTCFLCKQDFKVNYTKDLTSQIYVDTQFLEQIMKNPAQWIQHCLIKMNGRDLIKEQFTSTKKLAFEQYEKEGKTQLLAPFLKCAITGKRLVTPILMKNCPHPGTHVDYDEVFNLLKANGFKFESLKKPCSTCDAPKSFEDYLFDETFGMLLEKKLKHIHVDKGVKFDITKKQFVEMPSEQIFQEIAQLKTNPRPQPSQFAASQPIVAGPDQRFKKFADLFNEVKVGNSTFKCVGFNDGGVKIDQNGGVNADELQRRVAVANQNNSKFQIVGVKNHGVDVLNLQPSSNNGQEQIEEQKQQATVVIEKPEVKQLGKYDVDINLFNQTMIFTYRNETNKTLNLEEHHQSNEVNQNPPIQNIQFPPTVQLNDQARPISNQFHTEYVTPTPQGPIINLNQQINQLNQITDTSNPVVLYQNSDSNQPLNNFQLVTPLLLVPIQNSQPAQHIQPLNNQFITPTHGEVNQNNNPNPFGNQKQIILKPAPQVINFLQKQQTIQVPPQLGNGQQPYQPQNPNTRIRLVQQLQPNGVQSQP